MASTAGAWKWLVLLWGTRAVEAEPFRKACETALADGDRDGDGYYSVKELVSIMIRIILR